MIVLCLELARSLTVPLGSIVLLLHGRPPCAVLQRPVEEEGEPVLAGVAAAVAQVVGSLTLPFLDGVEA